MDREKELMKALSAQAIDAENNIENELINHDINQLLNKALDKLTLQQKRIFHMSRYDMKSHKEIAEALGISVYTVQQHISASLKIIRSYLQKNNSDYIVQSILMLLLTAS